MMHDRDDVNHMRMSPIIYVNSRACIAERCCATHDYPNSYLSRYLFAPHLPG